MPGKIKISNIHNIHELEFTIPDRGVWLLTAGNGAGKTSLLACIRRIGHPNAFPIHFPTSLRSDRLDNHSRGSITYEINDESVEYAYRGERWTPRPRSNSHLFQRFGYASVTYIGATADRITPRPEDFDPRLVRTVHRNIIDPANSIFETNKFSKLRTINLTRGAGNDAFVLALGNQPYAYHSEKHFSLGELCILKLLRLLKDVPNNSLIIVDELEMALHPRAQVNLLRFLEEQADTKSLTIIFSTHSVTLLKTIDKRQIIYLEKQDDDEIKPIYGCFPTFAIGNIAAEEETLPDILLYVEDIFARDTLTAFFEHFANERFENPSERPTTKVVPIGGFDQVVSFLERNRSVLPNRIVQKAVLDADVSQETLANWRQNQNHAQLARFQHHTANIKYLPFTPEVGIMDHINANLQNFEQRLRVRFGDNQLRIGHIIGEYDYALQGADRRRNAKAVVDELINHLIQRTQCSSDAARERLCGIFANSTWAQIYRPEFMRLFGPMVV